MARYKFVCRSCKFECISSIGKEVGLHSSKVAMVCKSCSTIDSYTVAHPGNINTEISMPPVCTSCHRSHPPKSHTALWRLRGHGPASAFDPEPCRVCHQPGMCIQCHRTTAPLNHRGAWGTVHGFAAGSFANDNCYVCHRRADCLACHKSVAH